MTSRAVHVASAALVFTFAPAALAAPRIADESGTPVKIVSSHVDTQVFIARGPVPSRPEEDPFEPIGVAPIDIKLAPGMYTMETVGPTQSVGHQTVLIDRWPTTIEVRTGDASVKTIGTILIATGVIAIVAGIVTVVTFGQGNDKNFNKFAVAIPLLVGGAAVTGIGIGMSFLGATNIAPAKQPTALPQGAMLNATLAF